MRLAHLDQKIPLHWGEAGQLAHALAAVLVDSALEELPPRPLSLVLSFGPLNKVRARLASRAAAERAHVGKPPKKPRLLTLRYDEVAALMRVLHDAPPAGLLWGEIQKASLRLERYIAFTRR